MTSLVPATDTTSADWIVTALTTFGESVHSLLPAGFPAYVRVFHPGYRFEPDSPSPWETRKGVRWTEIAAANGTVAHAGMQLGALTGSDQHLHRKQPGVYDHPPAEGSLPSEIAASLASLLGRHTSAAERCWFAVWNGFGKTTHESVLQAPTFHVPARDYFLLQGPIEALGANVMEGSLFTQSPNISWPDDQAWCVATEIDLNTTYIACSQEACDDLLAARELEAFQVDPAIGINWTSDALNPEPPRTNVATDGSGDLV